MTEIKTYWEDRTMETENMLRRVCDILVKHANPYMVQDLLASLPFRGNRCSTQRGWGFLRLNGIIVGEPAVGLHCPQLKRDRWLLTLQWLCR